ncbi:MAG: methyltransferase, TIGR04325 family [Bacteroidetes bacterium]|nr:methyltransferase, TIGR04325 family [Flavobacteriales bacterium]NOG56461.1 methyltransferase, TIGR04325 family [Bacteroidota bacterium]
MKQLIKGFIPPHVLTQLKKLKTKKYGWHGNYATWQEAEKESEGYDKQIIVEKVRASLKKVEHGEAVFERDSVLFFEEDFNWPFLTSILYVASKNESQLNVIDFGGSLGSSFFQNQKFLSGISSLNWNVIEQNHFVEIGKNEFQNNQLKFYYTIDECFQEQKPNCLLFSSMLQYVENPYQLLEGVLKYNFETIIIDRMPFNTKKANRICVQKVNPEIYDASYPCHLLEKESFVNFFRKNNYNLHAEFSAIDGDGIDYTYKGFIFERV